jgi:pyridoxal phosphate enzyme (YggS family)
MINESKYQEIIRGLESKKVTLVAVSKTKPVADIMALYELGQKDFGENYVQELVEKQQQLPPDIRWHFIGHLQSNKVRSIAPFVHLIHGVDSLKLLKEIDRQAEKNGRIIDVLLQVHIAQEETKFGLDQQELETILSAFADAPLQHIRIRGLMGMATFANNPAQVRGEFLFLRKIFDDCRVKYDRMESFNILSMGMSGDYQLAIESGSTMVRIGSLIFGERSANG